MWYPVWIWVKELRNVRQRPDTDRAGMGVEIGLDQSLDSMLPPLLGFAVDKAQRPSSPAGLLPLGTDLRSRHRASS